MQHKISKSPIKVLEQYVAYIDDDLWWDCLGGNKYAISLVEVNIYGT